jgi:hypothetical protein
MKLNKVEMGIHTIELYTGALKYSETQKVIDYVTDKGAIQIRSSDPYNLDRRMKSSYFIDRGITMRIHQSHNKSNGISFAVNPTSLLSRKYQPLKLYKPTKGNVMDMLEQLETLFKEIQLSHCDKPVINPENLSLSRMDLTLDLYCSKDTNLSSLIRIFRKSKCPRHYKRHELKGEKAHYFSFKNKKCCFKVYDKVYELKKFDRCPPEIKNQKILRLEVSVKREKFLKYFNLKRDHNLYIMLNAGYKEIRNVLVYYLDKLFPSSGTHLPYSEAVRKIKWSALDSNTKEQMLFLLKKTSRSAGLDIVACKWKDGYGIVRPHKFEKLMNAFDTIDVNPITLGNNEQNITPCLRKIIYQK